MYFINILNIATLQADFRDFPVELRQAISLARRMQDPLLEFSQLCTTEEDLLCLKLHTLQVKPFVVNHCYIVYNFLTLWASDLLITNMVFFITYQ